MTTHPGAVSDEITVIETFTNGILDPQARMLGPVPPGSRLLARTSPGCWGPMITPEIRGGHEVTAPIGIEGAEPGDAIVISITSVSVESSATASGNDQWMPDRFLGDPYVAGKCPGCNELYPRTHIEGVGQDAVRCDKCGADAAPFTFTNGYTIAFDAARSIGVTLNQESAEEIGKNFAEYARLPSNSIQNSILAFAPHDLVGLSARLQPFLGQFGTTPGVALPDSHNAGDFGSFLIGAPHEYAISAEELELRTDGHMDIDAVRAGAILVCPVKAPGAGIYLGDMHALQGDGEIAGHTCDVSGEVLFDVELIKGLSLDGPLLLPVPDDLPRLARPLLAEEKRQAREIARKWGVELEETAPISVIGTGPDLNVASDSALSRAATLLDVSVPEVKNRATITGAVEIGRLPGVVHVTFRAPLDKLDNLGLLPYIEQQYGALMDLD